MYIHIFVYTYTHIKMNICVYIGGLNAQIVILTDALSLSQGRVSTQNEVSIYIYIYVCMYVCIYITICAYIYIWICIY
jgi:hypothetical protein